MATYFIFLVILIGLSGFFSGSEVALLSVTPVRTRIYRKEGRKGSAALSKLKSDSRRMIITILIGNNVVNIGAASIVAYITNEFFDSVGLGVGAGILTFVILVFGEITPKIFASKYAGSIALMISPIILFFQYIFYPIVLFLGWFSGILERLFNFKQQAAITEAEIKEMVNFGVENKIVHHEEQQIINRALAFSDSIAKDVMIPLSDVFSLEQNTTIKDSLRGIIKSGYTRIPLYETTKDNIVGLAMVKDVAGEYVADNGSNTLRSISVEPIKVPREIRIDYLFKIFQSERRHMAVVYGEGNNVVGVVTLEDLIEELVGEIEDESDVNQQKK